ncbi:uncharacterized protein LOC120636744 [Pararge aegeria]|nr:uncharacterized protein LOC120636744 [Pararge aegeria]
MRIGTYPNTHYTHPGTIFQYELESTDLAGLKDLDSNYEEYFDDDNLYDDYIQSNSMTSYLIEKVQELHDWIISDADLEGKPTDKRDSSNSTNNNEFGQLLQALNESLVEGNVTIVMSKLRKLYYGENFTSVNQSRKVILSNSTNLLSFGILTLDVMLLHNIQLMAWENQESIRNKMLKDPDVFAFNALFMEPSKVEVKRNEIYHQYDSFSRRQNLRQEAEESDFGMNLLENVLEIGMSTARAAIHLGRAFKNTKMVLNQLSNREALNANIQNQLSRNIDANTHALNHLQTSFNKNDSTSSSVANSTNAIYTDLDCVWLLYCKNLVATAKLNAPYGTMARINGLALRMLTGEVPADRAIDIMMYEVLTGWTELKCTDMFPRREAKTAFYTTSDGYIAGLKDLDSNYEEYFDDDNLYDDYIQSNSMTSYLIEKVQELHDWIISDADLEGKPTDKRDSSNSTNNNEFGQLLQALNESLVEGNVTIVMSKLRKLYYGENFTSVNQSRKVILSNSTNLLSFGILTLDVMLLHNIQLMAWENQESIRNKMLKDPDVFAFNALFMEPSKVEVKRNEIYHQYDSFSRRQNLRQEAEESDFGMNLLENVLEIGMSTARAAIHLGRAFKNTKMVLNQLSNREALNANIQNQLSRNIDANTHALNHLQTSFNKNDSTSSSVANSTNAIYTDLDCVWLLYCKNLVATAKLNAPYGTMARINGLALRMLTGEVPADRAIDIMMYEVLTGWTELKCTDMFPRCSKANPATVVLDSILQPLRKSQNTSNRL